ncbi:hypothetical protein B4099_3681 [Heyndrickxia coagulans]|uniref:Uncharacterized protein n=1 Tax=Heyndrickxia coagulans TaxID=1398 RepID=A0A150KI55_HEYCO|nr:hypothetical protein B4099_3681 [Heyndrickxia coagulans]
MKQFIGEIKWKMSLQRNLKGALIKGFVGQILCINILIIPLSVAM